MTTPEASPAADGHRLVCGGIDTHYLDVGSGLPVILLHGSGPGVTAEANWRGTIDGLAGAFRAVAPEMVGYGFTERPGGIRYGVDTWVRHVIDFIDAMGFETFDLVGNSMGGLVSLHIAQLLPGRVRRMALMGTPSPAFQPTEGLRALRAYEPSFDNMRRLIQECFAFDQSVVTEAMVSARFEASRRPGVHETYRAMFQDAQHAGNALQLTEEGVAGITAPTLILHGREDKVIPVSCAWTLSQLIRNSDTHIFANAGHWTQIERRELFNSLLLDFLGAGDRPAIGMRTAGVGTA